LGHAGLDRFDPRQGSHRRRARGGLCRRVLYNGRIEARQVATSRANFHRALAEDRLPAIALDRAQALIPR
jgi:hypothetical protein